jgi:hypothetical protein
VKKKGAAMISQSCDIKEFIEAIKDKDYLEAIYLADKEATEAERMKFRPRAEAAVTKTKCCQRYANRLKGFINFVRYGVMNRSLGHHDLEALQSIRESLLSKSGLAPDPKESRLAS